MQWISWVSLQCRTLGSWWPRRSHGTSRADRSYVNSLIPFITTATRTLFAFRPTRIQSNRTRASDRNRVGENETRRFFVHTREQIRVRKVWLLRGYLVGFTFRDFGLVHIKRR